MRCAGCGLVFGIIVCVIALGAIAISFATDEWVHCEVSRSYADPNNPLYNCTYCPEMFYNRTRGMFRTCFPGRDSKWLYQYQYLRNSLVDSICVAERGYAVSPGDPTAQSPYYKQWETYYQMRIDMMRAHWALFVVTIALLVISIILSILGCWRLNWKMISVTTVIILTAVVANGIAMGLFHAYYSLEQSKIIQAPMIGLILQNSSYSDLRDATSCHLGFSYALGWVSFALEIIAFIIFSSASINLCLHPRKKREAKVTSKKQSITVQPANHVNYPAINRNPVYGFFDDAVHHSTAPTTYPIPLDPYNLHLPTGIPSNALRIPSYHQPGRFDVPMLHAKIPVNYY